jgi:uncharacterized protein with NRDE domain
MRPEHPLIVAANRDEFHARPSAAAAWWPDRPRLLAGRDLEAGGTWMGVSRSGRFAAVTNYRGAREPRARESRGALVTAALADAPASAIVAEIAPRAAEYSGFNLLVADHAELWWLANRGDAGARKLPPGIYGLGNTLLDAPEVAEAKAAFQAVLAEGPAVESLIEVLGRWRIVNPLYGTRCSTVLTQDTGRVRYVERGYAADGSALDTAQFAFAL